MNADAQKSVFQYLLLLEKTRRIIRARSVPTTAPLDRHAFFVRDTLGWLHRLRACVLFHSAPAAA